MTCDRDGSSQRLGMEPTLLIETPFTYESPHLKEDQRLQLWVREFPSGGRCVLVRGLWTHIIKV